MMIIQMPLPKPTVGEKVSINGNVGVITKVFEPCEAHSGKFCIEIHEKHYTHTEEFWWNDYMKSVLPIKEINHDEQKRNS